MIMCYVVLGTGILSLLLLMGGLILMYRLLTHGATPGTSTALDILAERFSRGEIDQADYTARRRVLEDFR